MKLITKFFMLFHCLIQLDYSQTSITSISLDLKFIFFFLQTPGPGTYAPCHPNVNLAKGPAYSIKGRHEIISEKTALPGPGAYSPEKVTIHFSFSILLNCFPHFSKSPRQQ